MMEWIIIVGLVIAMYIVIYKYEKKMDKLEQIVSENKSKIDYHCDKINEHDERINHNHERIDKNHCKLEEHDNHIEQMWITLPKSKE